MQGCVILGAISRNLAFSFFDISVLAQLKREQCKDCDLTASIVSPFGGDWMAFYWSSSARPNVTGGAVSGYTDWGQVWRRGSGDKTTLIARSAALNGQYNGGAWWMEAISSKWLSQTLAQWPGKLPFRVHLLFLIQKGFNFTKYFPAELPRPLQLI